MSSVNQPYVTANLVPDSSIVTVDKPRVLIVGTSANAAFVAPTLLQLGQQSSYELATDSQMLSLLGRGSTLERWRAADKVTSLDLLIVPSAAGGATTTLTVAATSGTPAGKISVSAFDAARYAAEVEVTSASTAAGLAAAIASGLSVATAPYSVAVAGAVITLTWQDGFKPASVPVHVTTPMGGAFSVTVAHTGDLLPSLTAVDAALFDVIGDQRYTHILWPDYYFSKIAVVDNLLKDRFNVFNDVASGASWSSMTRADVVTFQADTASLNTQNLILVATKLNGAQGSDKKRYPECDIAFIATAHARMLTDDADLTDLGFIAEGVNDYRGGLHMNSFPLHNIVIPTITANPLQYFSHVEQKLLNDANISTYGANRTGTTTISGNMLTMWKTDALGNVNLTYQQAEYLYTAMAIREFMDRSARLKYANQRMTNGETILGFSMVNKASVEEWVLSKYRELANLALVTKGADAEKSFIKLLNVTLIPAQTRIDIVATYEMVTHVGTINYTIKTTTKYGV